MSKIKYKKYEDDINLIGDHYQYCKQQQIPFVVIRKGLKWSSVEVDNIAISDKITKYIEENMNDNGWVNNVLVNIGIAKNDHLYKRFGRLFYGIDVKNEYAQQLAEYLFDVNYHYIRKYNDDNKDKKVNT